jgi:hypothetical protein
MYSWYAYAVNAQVDLSPQLVALRSIRPRANLQRDYNTKLNHSHSDRARGKILCTGTKAPNR